MWGRRFTVNLGPQIFPWEKRKAKEKNPLLFMELVNICCCVLGRGPRGACGGRKTGRIKIKDELLRGSFPLAEDTKQTGRGIRMRACVAAASRKPEGPLRWGGALGRGAQSCYLMGTPFPLNEMSAGRVPAPPGGLPGAPRPRAGARPDGEERVLRQRTRKSRRGGEAGRKQRSEQGAETEGWVGRRGTGRTGKVPEAGSRPERSA